MHRISERQELAQNIGTILLASNLGEIRVEEASALIGSLVDVAATKEIVERLRAERRAMSRPRLRVVNKSEVVAIA